MLAQAAHILYIAAKSYHSLPDTVVKL